MRTKVGHLAARIVPKEAEIVVDSIDIVRTHGCRSDPEVIVERRRRLRICDRCPITVRMIAGGNADVYLGHLADSSRAHQPACQQELGGGALLRASLNDSLVL